MGFELFQKEQAALERARTLLEEGVFAGEEEQHFRALVGAYEKLFKSTRKLVRLSDRSEAELNTVAKALDEKSRMLKSLSEKLSRYLPPQVSEAIFSGRSDAALTTERKKLTVFFSDIKDFTITTADMQPEDLTFLLNDYFSEMSQISMKHGATIDKFIGDAMLMFFGDPETKGVEEDARCCVRMAVEMQRRMVELEQKWKAKGFTRPFSMRIGINTGYCNVGNFGSEQRMDYTIIGGEVNLTARLESSADPGGILMSYESFALVKDLIDAEERESITMSGIHRDVKAYSVLNVLGEDVPRRNLLTHDDTGIQLSVNPSLLKGASRRKAVMKLKAVLEELEKPDQPKAAKKQKTHSIRPIAI